MTGVYHIATPEGDPARLKRTLLPDLLGPDGYIRLLPAAYFDTVAWGDLRLWCHFWGRYGLVTQELIAWLRDQIGSKRAIEIGSGCGDLAHHLGVPATDNRLQERPEIRRFYEAQQQPVIVYPAMVESLDAAAALAHYQPDVVVASWVTEWVDPTKPVPPQGGNMFGIKEDELVGSGVTYILIGNQAVHGRKPIMGLPHQTHALPFLRSRGHDRQADRVWIWNG